MIRSYRELDDSHIDALCELGSIGAGNAATALSNMLSDTVRISVPSVILLGYSDIINMVGDPEDTRVTVMIRFDGDVQGVVLFVIGCDEARDIADLLIENISGECSAADTSAISDMQLSAIKETGNIVGSSYLGAVSAMTGFNINISVPQAAVDMVGASMSAAMSEFSAGNDGMFLIDGIFLADARRLDSHVILFADVPSLNSILDRLGAG